jgi:uncharacterized protein YpmB
MAANKITPTKQAKSNVGGSATLVKKTSPFSARKGFLVAGALALVGLIVVAFSFASTAKPYQYAASQACVLKPSLVKPSCVNKSADAAVYRVYQGILGRRPDQSGYAYWVQALAGDKVSSERFIALFASEPQAKAKLATLVSDEDFVTYMYKNFQGVDKVVTSSDYWVKRLKATGSTKVNRNEVMRQFVFNEKTTKYFQPTFLAYITDIDIIKPTAIVYVAEGVYVEPVFKSMPRERTAELCGNATGINSQALSRVPIAETGRYKSGLVNRYACRAYKSVKPDNTVAAGAVALPNETINITCPVGYKAEIKVRSGGVVGEIPLPKLVYKACKKS